MLTSLINSTRSSSRAFASLPALTTRTRHFSTSPIAMGVTKIVHQEGSGPQPTKGQTVTIEYTGYLKDTSKPDNKGKQYVDALKKITEQSSPVN